MTTDCMALTGALQEGAPPAVPVSASYRSRIGNGSSLFLTGLDGVVVDGRTTAARTFRDLFEQLAEDAGGVDYISQGQRELCRRAAQLGYELVLAETKRAAGQPLDVDTYIALSAEQRRVLDKLGIRRQVREVIPWGKGNHRRCRGRRAKAQTAETPAMTPFERALRDWEAKHHSPKGGIKKET